MKYIFAIITCSLLAFIFHFIGVTVLGWEYGGGAIPNGILAAILVFIFYYIIKKKPQKTQPYIQLEKLSEKTVEAASKEKKSIDEKNNIDADFEARRSTEKKFKTPANLKTNYNKKLLLKIFKVLSLLIIAILIIFFSLAGYLYYKEEILPEKKMLSFATNFEWNWYDRYKKIQINTANYKIPMLRKVYLEGEYVIYAYKDKDYTLNAFVNFVTDCIPNTEIRTSQKFSDGTPKNLECDKTGNFLSFSVSWGGKRTDFVWEENLDGFNFKEDFSYWDFTKLDQKITLYNAKLEVDGEHKQIKVKKQKLPKEQSVKLALKVPVSIAKQFALGVKKIVIDPGCGGGDYGVKGYYKGVWEKDITLKMANQLASILRDRIKCSVILTRATDKDLTFEERIAIANTERGDLFISLHCNTSENTKFRGIETRFPNLVTGHQTNTNTVLENTMLELMERAKFEESKKFAENVHQSIISGMKKQYSSITDLGVQQSISSVLQETTIPSILIQMSVLSNEEECKRMMNFNYKKNLCMTIADGIEKYIETFQ